MGTEINIAVNGISVAFIDKSRHNFNDFINIIGCKGMDRCRADTESSCINFIFLDVAGGNIAVPDALFLCTTNHLIVNIGEILHEFDLIATIFKIAAEHIKDDKATGVTDMEEVIDSRATRIHGDLSLFNRYKFLASCVECIIKLHESLLSVVKRLHDSCILIFLADYAFRPPFLLKASSCFSSS